MFSWHNRYDDYNFLWRNKEKTVFCTFADSLVWYMITLLFPSVSVKGPKYSPPLQGIISRYLRAWRMSEQRPKRTFWGSFRRDFKIRVRLGAKKQTLIRWDSPREPETKAILCGTKSFPPVPSVLGLSSRWRFFTCMEFSILGCQFIRCDELIPLQSHANSSKEITKYRMNWHPGTEPKTKNMKALGKRKEYSCRFSCKWTNTKTKFYPCFHYIAEVNARVSSNTARGSFMSQRVLWSQRVLPIFGW